MYMVYPLESKVPAESLKLNDQGRQARTCMHGASARLGGGGRTFNMEWARVHQRTNEPMRLDC